MSSIITIRSRCHTYPHEWHGECFRYTHNGEIKTLSWREIKAIEKGLKGRHNDLLTTTEGLAWSLAKKSGSLHRLPNDPSQLHSNFLKGGLSRVPSSTLYGAPDRWVSRSEGASPFSIVP